MLPHEFMLAHRDELSEQSPTGAQQSGGPPLTQDLQVFLGDDFRALETEPSPEHAMAIVGRSALTARLRHSVGQLVRRSRAPVLLVGEAGSGRRHSALAIHWGTYPEGEFFELDADDGIRQLDEKLAVMRLRVSAPSTAGMTIYVHDLAEASALVQLRLVKLLQEQALQIRVVVSCARDLGQARRDGQVRPDLLFRFPTKLELPALRDRIEDIPELVRHFAEQSAYSRGAGVTAFSLAALERLQRYSWPRNLSELASIVERVSLAVGEGTVQKRDLPDLDERPSGAYFILPPGGIDLAELERELLTQALVMARNNQTRAAALLGLTRDQMRYRLAKFEIQGTADDRSEAPPAYPRARRAK